MAATEAVKRRFARGPLQQTVAIGAALAVFVLTGCRAGDLEFVQDRRLNFVAPAHGDRVDVPVTLEWELDEADPIDPAAFALFIDRAPVPPGESIFTEAAEDDSCARDPRCPDEEFLASLGIFVTTTSTFVLEDVPRDPAGVDHGRHFVYIVIVDAEGNRLGEAQWRRDFRTGGHDDGA